MTDKKKCYVGIDTSNYTTSIAVCEEDGKIVANLKAPLPVKEGERGLRQSDAVFAHTKNLPQLMDKLAKELESREPIAIGVSSTPRSVKDSYMPCFLCGVAAAHSFGASKKLPIYETSHQNGHIMAAIYSSGAFERLMDGRFLAFHVSGGTTEALIVTPNAEKNDFKTELVGGTNDINAGQAIDRVGVMLGLAFPAGKELEALALSFGGKLEKRSVCVNDGYCNLSGVENIAKALLEKGEDKARIAAFVFDFIERTLCETARQLIEKYGEMPILFAGGVMSNKLMRKAILARFEAYFAEPEFSADNAAGVALLCRLKHDHLRSRVDEI